MKQLMNFTLRFVGVLIAAMSFVFGITSCKDDTTTDSTSFALYYTSMTDISPTMTGTIASPTYKGAEPSGFSITGVTFGENNEAYTGTSFSIDETTGVVTISETSELQVGKYKISVSCIAGGKAYHFKDAIVVNFMKAVPEGITVEPAELLVEYADAINTDNPALKLPTAQVKTDGDHISITGYEISGIKKDDQVIENFPDPLFAVSSTGEISVVKGNKKIGIGTYVISLKLNTAVAGSDSEMGLFADAVKVNIVSKPLALTYTPNEDLLEESASNETEYISLNAPVLEGSAEDVNYSIASVSPATDKISIDSETGKIIVAKGHGFKKDESYTINVLVKNRFCEEGVLFENVFKLNIVELIQPIQNFSYPETTVKQALEIDVKKDDSFLGGGNLSFAFSEEDKAKYEGILNLDPTNGNITAPKYNVLEQGSYDIHVIATNNKTPDGVEAILKLNIVENENYFTHISYGNNLVEEQSFASVYDNQFRYKGTSGVKKATFTPKLVYMENGQLVEKNVDGLQVKWSIESTYNLESGKTPNFNNGELSNVNASNNKISLVWVKAVVGNGDEAIERRVPVFFSVYSGDNTATVLYTPFVLHVNPKHGYRSEPPTYNAETVKFLDYRRDFTYINLNGTNSNGDQHISNTEKIGDTNNTNFLGDLWRQYYDGRKVQYGSKGPLSYFLNTDNLGNALAYVDNTDGANKYSVVVNPNKWYNDGWADGVLFGQMTFSNISTDHLNSSENKNQIFPIVIWLDKDYSQK